MLTLQEVSTELCRGCSHFAKSTSDKHVLDWRSYHMRLQSSDTVKVVRRYRYFVNINAPSVSQLS